MLLRRSFALGSCEKSLAIADRPAIVVTFLPIRLAGRKSQHHRHAWGQLRSRHELETLSYQ
jgi:hypothetical protein